MKDNSAKETNHHHIFKLFLVSFLLLFLELAFIRYLASTVVFLTFFTNIILVSCFLGMSVGCLAASRKQNLINTVIPLILLTILFAWGILWTYSHYGEIMIDVGGQNSPQLIYFGTEYRAKNLSSFIIPIQAVAGLFFVLVALIFVGLGQTMGRLFNLLPNRIGAYTVNILGSLSGIVVFAIFSFYSLSPIYWFSLCLILCFYFCTSMRPIQILAALAALLAISLSPHSSNETGKTTWSPYYKIRQIHSLIETNNIGHQQMMPIKEMGSAYSLIHLLNRDTAGSSFKDVLVIGAGSGNDVQAALAFGAEHIDAVEIDPEIYKIGKKQHPDHPYQDPRVKIHIDDGRSFLKQGSKQYDLIIYALVDSLILQSGFSSIRLESYLFTEQAFRDAQKRLKPNGVFAMYNYYRQGWVISRLAQTAQQVFGSEPLVMPLPFEERITPDAQANNITFLLTGSPNNETLKRIRDPFNNKKFFWINRTPSKNDNVHAFGKTPPIDQDPVNENWLKIGLANVESSNNQRIPTDNWPFLYLRDPNIPKLLIHGMIIVAILSLIILFVFAPVRQTKLNGQMFFLGAGFMLLETKGVVQMALLFGSTWIVNSIVFSAILIMILLSNLFVIKCIDKDRLWPYYLGLILALTINTLIPMDQYLGLSGWLKIFTSCAVLFTPIFFAGVIFSILFRKSSHPNIDLGSNIAGVILGALCENLSLIIGFNHLLIIAIAFYLLSIIFKPKAGIGSGDGQSANYFRTSDMGIQPS